MNHVRLTRCLAGVFVVTLGTFHDACGSWRDAEAHAVLANDAIQAKFQSGRLYQLTDRVTGNRLVDIEPAALPSSLIWFDASPADMDAWTVTQRASDTDVRVTCRTDSGNVVAIHWRMEPGKGDLVLRMQAQTPEPVEEIRMIFPGCDIENHRLVWISGYGVGHGVDGPWNDMLLGDPEHVSSPSGFPHPPLVLFEGDGAGWVIEGRDPRIGPACAMVKGHGMDATVGLVRRFAPGTDRPEHFEIRIRAYQDSWTHALDPFIAWMESTGYARIGSGHHPDWVSDIDTQIYLRVGDYGPLEQLATMVDPARTIIGRLVGWRNSPMDTNYPDYTPNPDAAKWFKRCRDLAFHVGAHFNSQRMSRSIDEMVKQMRPGLLVTGHDEHGNELYDGIPGRGLITVSSAFKPWRSALVREIGKAVADDVGVDLIYLDESMTPGGPFLVDGVNGLEGVQFLMQELHAAYPRCAIETEQFNMLTAKNSSFALSQMPLGHPMTGYLFSPFIKILPEGQTSAPNNIDMIASIAHWGFLTPPLRVQDASWMAVGREFQKHGFRPDLSLERARADRYEGHWSHGVYPVFEGLKKHAWTKIFGYTGRNGVKGWYEMKSDRIAFAVYEPGREARRVGTRVAGYSEWSGPGCLSHVEGGPDVVAVWHLYNETTQLGLDPSTSYLLDKTYSLPQEVFHVTAVPDDFALWHHRQSHIASQYSDPDGNWAMIHCVGNGLIEAYVPEGWRAFVDGVELIPNPTTRLATGELRSNDLPYPGESVVTKIETDNVATQLIADKLGKINVLRSKIIAFRETDNLLVGRWVDLPWNQPHEQRTWHVGQHERMEYPADGPLRMPYRVNAFYNKTSGRGVMAGKLPVDRKIRMVGGYKLRDDGSSLVGGDGTVRINGTEVVYLNNGQKPFTMMTFDVDLTPLAGEHIMLEFAAEGHVGGVCDGDWYDPKILVE